jgi:hypothetical protein
MKAVMSQYKVYENLQKKAMKMKIACSVSLWSLPPPCCITTFPHPEKFQPGTLMFIPMHTNTNIFMLITYGIKFYNVYLSLVTII